jgi:transcriptional regulator with XRE-family HTH domain
LGSHLRRLRLKRGESLAMVAEAVGISIGFLSNIERSRSGASVGIMRKLARYYKTNILDFFDPIEASGPLVRPKDRKILEGGPGVHMELLAAGQISMEPHLFRIEPEAESGESYAHEGEEFLFMVRGHLTIMLENEEYHLRAGDSFYFRSHTPHRWLNPGETTALVLWINTPPTF